MYYIHTDFPIAIPITIGIGSYQTITNEQGNVVEELSFGSCPPVRNAMKAGLPVRNTMKAGLSVRNEIEAGGRRRNPTDWTYNNMPTSYLFDRGFTGHEHLDNFDLINMPARRNDSGGGNGRMYDPWLGRFLSPDPFIQAPTYSQNFNRYSYALNNPLKYTDPSGEFAILDSWLIGYINGFFSHGGNISSRTFYATVEANHRADNDGKITAGLFATDENKTFGGRVWEVVSRFTWQSPQILGGFLYNQSVNTFTSQVEDVVYFHGATYVVGSTKNGNAVTLGSYISISPNWDDPEHQSEIKIGEGGYTTMHEYGHYLQNQKSGPLFLLKYGIPSALGDADWTEIDANTRSAAYFHKIDPNFNWVQTPSRYRTLTDKVYNPKWFEYPLFFTGIGISLIIIKNWNEPW